MFNLAICITLLRIALTPVIVFCMVQNFWYAACLIFIGAVLTDLLDGFVARRLGQSSKFGQILDPVADKILLCSVMMTMLSLQNYFSIFFYFLLCKEIILLAGGAIFWFGYKKFIAPSKLSRFVGFLEICFVLFMFVMRLQILPQQKYLLGVLICLLMLNILFSCWLLLRYANIVWNQKY